MYYWATPPTDMTTNPREQDEVLIAIREVARTIGRPPSKREFMSSSGMTEYQVLKYFPSWREAVHAAGLEPDSTNVRLDPSVLLEDWGEVVRRARRIPTRHQYRRDGKFSPGVFEKKFGPWSNIPAKFREFAEGRTEWTDVVALLPTENSRATLSADSSFDPTESNVSTSPNRRHTKLDDRPTYGNPIDFRGLRNEPVNEGGVVFLFGMVARELGYMVEAVRVASRL